MGYSNENVLTMTFGCVGAPANNNYLYPGWHAISANEIGVTVPATMRLVNMRVLHRVAAGGGNTVTYTVRQNAASSIATCGVVDPAVEGSWAGTLVFSDGDEIGVLVTSGGVGATADVTVTLLFQAFV